jgi:mRNA interferase YafQ
LKYRLFKTNQFKRSFKKLKLSNEEEVSYIDIAYHLLNGLELKEKYRDHKLKGDLKEFRELHIKPDLLLVYKIENDVVKFVDIGSHSELFNLSSTIRTNSKHPRTRYFSMKRKAYLYLFQKN